MRHTVMNIARPTIPDSQLEAWQAEFAAAARRPLAVRMRYSFIRTYKPVLDDAPYRSFDTLDGAGIEDEAFLLYSDGMKCSD